MSACGHCGGGWRPRLWHRDGRSTGYRLSQGDRDAYAAAHGNAAAAWRLRAAAGATPASWRVFQMAIRRELLPIERAAAANGVDGQRRHTVYLRWEASGRNERWEADHVELPVLVMPPRGTRPRRPWVTVFIDAYSRLVMGWSLALGPSAATVLAALRMGIHIDLARGDFGGVPRALRPDRGLEFVSEALAGVCAVLGMQLLPVPSYTPHLKGKVERFNRTLAQEFLCTLPFYTNGPRDKTGRLYDCSYRRLGWSDSRRNSVTGWRPTTRAGRTRVSTGKHRMSAGEPTPHRSTWCPRRSSVSCCCRPNRATSTKMASTSAA